VSRKLRDISHVSQWRVPDRAATISKAASDGQGKSGGPHGRPAPKVLGMADCGPSAAAGKLLADWKNQPIPPPEHSKTPDAKKSR